MFEGLGGFGGVGDLGLRALRVFARGFIGTGLAWCCEGLRDFGFSVFGV